MIWKGVEVKTFGQITRVLEECQSKEEAQKFMEVYRKESPHADANIGYLSGYFSHERMARIQDWFGVSHPIFGRKIPTDQQAFDAGRFTAGVHMNKEKGK